MSHVLASRVDTVPGSVEPIFPVSTDPDCHGEALVGDWGSAMVQVDFYRTILSPRTKYKREA